MPRIVLGLLAASLIGSSCEVAVCRSPSSKVRLVLDLSQVPRQQVSVLEFLLEIRFQADEDQMVVRRSGRLALQQGMESVPEELAVLLTPGIGSAYSEGDRKERTFQLRLIVSAYDSGGALLGRGNALLGDLGTETCNPSARLVLRPVDCQDADDGAECSLDGSPGSCLQGECRPAVCGDETFEPWADEQCERNDERDPRALLCTDACRLRPTLLDLGRSAPHPQWRAEFLLDARGACGHRGGWIEALWNGPVHYEPPDTFRGLVPFTMVPVPAPAGDVPGIRLALGLPGASVEDASASVPTSHEGALLLHPGSLTWPTNPRLLEGADALLVWPGRGESSALFGFSVAAGDLDGDGLPDIAVGGPGHSDEGRVVVLATGRVQLSAPGILEQTAPEVMQILPTGDSVGGAGFGWSVLLVDLTGDGIDDLVVGAPGWGSGGAIAVYVGGQEQFAPWEDPTLAQPNLLIRFTPPEGSSQSGFGASLAAGDLDADGLPELLVGSPRGPELWDGWPGVHVFSLGQWQPQDRAECTGNGEAGWDGPCAGTARAIRAPIPENTNAQREEFGAVLAAGDLDGDGLPELAVSAPSRDPSGMSSVYLYRGTDLPALIRDDESPDPAVHFQAPAAWAFGARLTTGDMSGDRLGDLLLAAPHWSEAETTDATRPRIWAGAVYVFPGTRNWAWPEGGTQTVDLRDLEAAACPPEAASCDATGPFGTSLLVVHGPWSGAQLGIALGAVPIPDGQVVRPALLVGLTSSNAMASVSLAQACSIVAIFLDGLASVTPGIVSPDYNDSVAPRPRGLCHRQDITSLRNYLRQLPITCRDVGLDVPDQGCLLEDNLRELQQRLCGAYWAQQAR